MVVTTAADAIPRFAAINRIVTERPFRLVRGGRVARGFEVDAALARRLLGEQFPQLELESIELFVQKADFVTVSDPERVEFNPRSSHIVTAIAELIFEPGQPRMQILELVFGMRSRRYQRAHTQMISDAGLALSFPATCLIPH